MSPSATKPPMFKSFRRLAWFAVALATVVIVFGAFVRLSNAGLSCPDWPTCYGRAAWPTASTDVAHESLTSIRAIEPHKAWREQFHRIIAGVLGVLVLALALIAARRRPHGMTQVLVAAALVAASIPLYMHAQYLPASLLALAGEVILLAAAWRWSNGDLSRAAALTLAVIVFQALLGMWTVTWLLKPVVVMAHLLGGLLTFSLLLWMAWRAIDMPIRLAEARWLRTLVIGGLLVLGVQIALGGWTSANYAALSCGAGGWLTNETHGFDFPKCAGQWWPNADWREGFVLWRGIGVDYEGGILDARARIAIQLAHRVMAGIVFVYLIMLAVRLMRTPGMRTWAVLLGALTLAQVTLGVANVKLALPLWVAVMHNAGALLLLFVLVTLLARLRAPAHE